MMLHSESSVALSTWLDNTFSLRLGVAKVGQIFGRFGRALVLCGTFIVTVWNRFRVRSKSGSVRAAADAGLRSYLLEVLQYSAIFRCSTDRFCSSRLRAILTALMVLVTSRT